MRTPAAAPSNTHLAMQANNAPAATRACPHPRPNLYRTRRAGRASFSTTPEHKKSGKVFGWVFSLISPDHLHVLRARMRRECRWAERNRMGPHWGGIGRLTVRTLETLSSVVSLLQDRLTPEGSVASVSCSSAASCCKVGKAARLAARPVAAAWRTEQPSFAPFASSFRSGMRTVGSGCGGAKRNGTNPAGSRAPPVWFVVCGLWGCCGCVFVGLWLCGVWVGGFVV